MIATLLSLAGYLLYLVCMIALSYMVCVVLIVTCQLFDEFDDKYACFFMCPICHSIVLALKNFLWVVLISEFHYTLPSSVSQVRDVLLCLACYLVYTMIGAVVGPVAATVVMCTCESVSCAALGLPLDDDSDELNDFMFFVFLVVPFVVMDILLSYSDMMATVLSVTCYLICMVALSCLVLAIATGSIEITKIWWPELIHTSIIALTLLLLNMMWGSPFQKPTSTDDPNLKWALVGYLIYIVSSMAVSFSLFGLRLLLRTFVISLTLMLLDMFVKPSSVSDTIINLASLSGMIATTLMALFFLVALSFVVFMCLHTWVEMLVPSAWRAHPARTFVCIIGLTFTVMKIVLEIPVEGSSIFSEMKDGLLGITDMINGDHGVYKGIRNLAVLSILISMESRRIVSGFQLYTKAAFIVTLGVLLTMPPGPGTSMEKPAFTLVSDEFVQERITSFVSSQIEWMDGKVKQLTDS